jgi:hypothetical protein
MIGLRSPLAVVILSCAALVGCAAEPLAPDATFVLHGSGHAPPADPGVKSPQSNHGGTLNPVSLAVGLYALSLSASAPPPPSWTSWPARCSSAAALRTATTPA